MARKAGFADFRRMAVVFRRELDTTPTAYRRQTRNLTSIRTGQRREQR